MTASSAIWAMASGLGAGLGLIVAIGAQNTFVLRQGVHREHVLPVVVVCAASDAVLITAGVGGMGALVESAPAVLSVLRYAGAVFLLGYAILAARRAVSPGSLTADRVGVGAALGATVATCLALTWLNPHVYLDTVVMLGGIANTYPDPGRWFLAAGAVLASVLWFTALGYGARLLRPLFASPRAWRYLDGGIGVLMLALSAKLVADGLSESF